MVSQRNDEGAITMVAPDRVYSNQGNAPLVDLIGKDCKRLLDVGCGAGDNALLIKSKHPECSVFGITYSVAEAELANKNMARCWVLDIEGELPDDLTAQSFDVLLFSHVLEHLRDPADVLSRFVRLLPSGGIVLIAVPNILSWRMRLQFLWGNFEYQPSGELDDTHLRFFTYFTADKALLSGSLDLQVTYKLATGSMPLWWLRRYVIPRRWAQSIDQWGCHHWPNLFGIQVLIQAIKR